MNYLTLTNQVLAELNEVQLTSSNFVSGAVGIQQTTKDVVNKALRDVYASELEWPWLHSDKIQTTFAGQQEYSLPADYRSVDFDSFYLVPTELVTNSLFTSDISNWTTSSGTPAYNSGGNGRLRLNSAAAYATLSTIKNKTYRIQIRVIDSSSGGSSLKLQVGTSAAGTQNLNTTVTVSNFGDGNILDTKFTATASTSFLTLDNDSSTNLDVDFVKVSENLTPKKLTYITYDDYRRRFLTTSQINSSDQYGTPDYVYKSQDGKFGLYRIPKSDGYAINFEYWKTHSDLSAITDTPDIPARFHDVIIARAKYYIYQLRSDPQFTQFAASDYLSGIKRMRIELINSPTEMLDRRVNLGRSRGALSGG
tara:strand:+ start:12127 stop:13221 length:1095 start_codon:yes stop_codon:yes gene_type:complete